LEDNLNLDLPLEPELEDDLNLDLPLEPELENDLNLDLPLEPEYEDLDLPFGPELDELNYSSLESDLANELSQIEKGLENREEKNREMSMEFER
ncbi:hypothetical protein ACQKML_24120, partial [Peribacillus frigoritolerans]